ncbi:MAG: flagellar hook-associated protein 3 [Nitrospirae bacterium]|nr:MAG: flagellar hook-associated protein 3 [Nitrospirota bacterium]
MSRITTRMIYDSILNSMQDSIKGSFNIYEQLASGRKINRPSDDPSAMSRITDYNVQLSSINQYSRSISDVRLTLKTVETSLNGLSQNVALVKGVAAKTMGMGGVDRKAYTKTVESIISTMIDIANTKSGDKYVFSGQKADAPAVDRNTGEFVGSTDYVEAEIGAGVKVLTNIPGNQIFSFKRINPADSSVAVMPTYNWNNSGAITLNDADPQSGRYTANGSFTAGTNVFTVNGGTVTINGTAVAIAAGRTLNQTASDINAANAGVKAAVVNFNTTGAAANDDYRIVLGSTTEMDITKTTISVVTADGAGTGLNLFSNLTLGTDITNYNYISDPTNPNYYSFNNNYLNENNMLRAVNYLKEAIDNDDTRRISKGSDYLTKVLDNLKTKQIDVGVRLDMIEMEDKFEISRKSTVTNNLSDIRDVQQLDYAQLSIQVQLKQQSLESLRKLSSEFMGSSLFDFI